MAISSQVVDVLIITAIKEEHDAAIKVGLLEGIPNWEQEAADKDILIGRKVLPSGRQLSIALARPTRSGPIATTTLAAKLVPRLSPKCIAMCGVCAGNPAQVSLGDVLIAEMAYEYDEGKKTVEGFVPDHRPVLLPDSWVRAAQDMGVSDLRCWEAPSELATKIWLLERLEAGVSPKKHPAYARFFPKGSWKKLVKELEAEKLVQRRALELTITQQGVSWLQDIRFYEEDAPSKLPIDIMVGPIASGSAVIKDGLTWDDLTRWGVRTVLGLEMEAAAIALVAHRLSVPYWIVAKGVMDYADPRKDDRYKEFAALASAEVLFKFIFNQLKDVTIDGKGPELTLAKSVYIIGGTTGETTYPAYEDAHFQEICNGLGGLVARSGAELIACSPFTDSADLHCVMGYVRSGHGRVVQWHSPQHPSVNQASAQLAAMLGESPTKIVQWNYPGPEKEEEWQQAWLLCQLQALDRADVVIAIGGKTSGTANTLLHLADAKGIPVVPFSFFGGAAKRMFNRRDWGLTNPSIDISLLQEKGGVEHALKIADILISDKLRNTKKVVDSPKRFFISRARGDSHFSDALAAFLLQSGMDPILGDHAVQVDRMVPASIHDALIGSDVAVVLWSRLYAASTWCYDELELSIDRLASSSMAVWLFNLDGSDVVPRHARELPQLVTRTPEALVSAVKELLGPV